MLLLLLMVLLFGLVVKKYGEGWNEMRLSDEMLMAMHLVPVIIEKRLSASKGIWFPQD